MISLIGFDAGGTCFKNRRSPSTTPKREVLARFTCKKFDAHELSQLQRFNNNVRFTFHFHSIDTLWLSETTNHKSTIKVLVLFFFQLL